MEIRVISGNIDESPSLNEYIIEHLNKSVKKYFTNAVRSEVHFKKEGSNFLCTIFVNEGVTGGIEIKSDHESSDIYNAFDEAKTKVEKQLRRYKDKISNHRSQKHS